MASARKEQKEIDQATKHLMDYVCTSQPWAHLYDDMMDGLCANIAEALNRPIDDVLEELLGGPQSPSALGFMFEEMAVSKWHLEGCAITEYLKQRGWREGTHGKRYLRTLAETEVRLWEVVNIEPDEWIDVRRYGTQKKTKRVFESSFTDYVEIGDCLAARVLLIGKRRSFSGAILTFSQQQAVQIQQTVDNVPAEIKQLFQKLLDEKEIDKMPDELDQQIIDEQDQTFVETAFKVWGINQLLSHPTVPKVHNTDDQELVFTKHQFAIKGDRSALKDILNKHFKDHAGNAWNWLQEDDATVMGNLTIQEEHLILVTNSVERGNKGIALLQSLLGDAIGQPMGVHQSMESAIANQPAGIQNTGNDNTVQNDP